MLPGSLTHQAKLSADFSSLAQARLQRTLTQDSTQPSLTGAGWELLGSVQLSHLACPSTQPLGQGGSPGDGLMPPASAVSTGEILE